MSNLFALVVEDNEEQADILAKALQAAGFETEIVETGDAAIARLAVMVPDLVVLDLNLPGVSGTSILLHIRSDARLTGTRVIIVTVEPHLTALLRDEADVVLTKPIDFIQLRDTAARLCSATLPGE